MIKKRRVVVTGLGTISPHGNDVGTAWARIKNGISGVTLNDKFNVDGYAVQIAATVKDFDPLKFVEKKDTKRMDHFIVYGIAATAEAIHDAKLDLQKINIERVGVALGSGIGGISTITHTQRLLNEGGPKRVNPFFIPSSIVNMGAGQISIKYGFKGPNFAVVTACTTGAHNIGFAARSIAYGDAEIMIAGGSEMATTPICIAGFHAIRALSCQNDEPHKASRPWDKNRDGFVLGEGSGVLVLEEYEHAVKRSAKIYAELIGFGMSADGFHMTAPDPAGDGGYQSMKAALKDASIQPKDIDYINAHSTSTPVGDEIELKAIHRLFDDCKDIAVSSTKSMTGHLLGAAGAIEAIYSVLSIRDNTAPPTINLDEPEQDHALNLVPHEAQTKRIDYVLSNSFGFGGTNATLIFKKPD